MILVYEKDPALAEGVKQALVAAGHEVELLETFLGAVEIAQGRRPEAVLFEVDVNSSGTFATLRQALAADGIPVVATGTPRRLYFAMYGVMFGGALASVLGPARFLTRPYPPEAAREELERAIPEGPALAAAVASPHRRRAIVAAATITGIALAVVAASMVLEHGATTRLGARVWSTVGNVVLWTFNAVVWGIPAVIAWRRGLRPPRWVVAALALVVVAVAAEIGLLVRLALLMRSAP